MELQLVENSREYFEFIRLLRNDTRVQPGFLELAQITAEQQEAYMKIHGHLYYVCLCEGQPAGYIGQIDGDIRIATHPDFQKKGIGLFMLRAFIEKHPDCTARVKVSNQASLALFRKAGFREHLVVFQPPGQPATNANSPSSDDRAQSPQ